MSSELRLARATRVRYRCGVECTPYRHLGTATSFLPAPGTAILSSPSLSMAFLVSVSCGSASPIHPVSEMFGQSSRHLAANANARIIDPSPLAPAPLSFLNPQLAWFVVTTSIRIRFTLSRPKSIAVVLARGARNHFSSTTSSPFPAPIDSLVSSVHCLDFPLSSFHP